MPDLDEDMDLCVVCQEHGANFDDMYCSSCYHRMWDFQDDLAAIIGYVCDLVNNMYYADDIIPRIIKVVEKLRESMSYPKNN